MMYKISGIRITLLIYYSFLGCIVNLKQLAFITTLFKAGVVYCRTFSRAAGGEGGQKNGFLTLILIHGNI